MVLLNQTAKNVSLCIYLSKYIKKFILNFELEYGYEKINVNSIPAKKATFYFAIMTTVIKVQFETRNAFKGFIFVEDHLADPSCRSTAAENVDDERRNASIRLGFKSCDVERRRSVEF